MKYVYTSSARNFLPCARALLKSVREHMPDVKFVYVLTDEWDHDAPLLAEGFDEAYTAKELLIEQGIKPEAWIFRHNIMELATAVKPLILKKLLARDDTEWAMFFDPDCVLYDPLVELRQAVERHSIVLTPHQTKMEPNDKWLFFERNPMKVGIYNLGYLGAKATPTAQRFADWWWARLIEHCVADSANGLFTDQKWLDFLPSYTDDYAIMRDGRYNFARWNSFQREISRSNDGAIIIDGKPAGFIHFSGFYKIGEYVQGLYDRSSKPYLNNVDLLDELSQWYSKEIWADQHRPELMSAWAYDQFSNGEQIEPSHRALYRADNALQTLYANPFDVSDKPSFYHDLISPMKAANETGP